MMLPCGHCGEQFRRESFRVTVPQAPVVDVAGKRQAYIKHLRCGVTTVIRESMARNIGADKTSRLQTA